MYSKNVTLDKLQLAALDGFLHGNDRFRRRSRVLAEGQNVTLDEGHPLDCEVLRPFLVLAWVDAVSKARQAGHDRH